MTTSKQSAAPQLELVSPTPEELLQGKIKKDHRLGPWTAAPTIASSTALENSTPLLPPA
jgi:hypothetical protein